MTTTPQWIEHLDYQYHHDDIENMPPLRAAHMDVR